MLLSVTVGCRKVDLIPMDHELLFLLGLMDKMKAVGLICHCSALYLFLLDCFLMQCTGRKEKEGSQ